MTNPKVLIVVAYGVPHVYADAGVRVYFWDKSESPNAEIPEEFKYLFDAAHLRT